MAENNAPSDNSRYRIGQAYGGSAAGRTNGAVKEWEWVHTGRDFALGHPKGRVRGGMFAVIGFVALHGGGVLYLAIQGSFDGYVLALIDALAVIAMVIRWQIAWVLVWIPLIVGFPLSLPVMFYWAEGTRPNLIYRHRFERLAQQAETSDHVH